MLGPPGLSAMALQPGLAFSKIKVFKFICTSLTDPFPLQKFSCSIKRKEYFSSLPRAPYPVTLQGYVSTKPGRAGGTPRAYET